MLFNYLMHPDDDIEITKKIRSDVGNNKIVQAVENSLFDDGVANKALNIVEKLGSYGSKAAGRIIKIIDGIKILYHISTYTNESIYQESIHFQNYPVPQKYQPQGVMLDKNGKYVSNFLLTLSKSYI